PLGPLAEGSHDMVREHRVLSRLWKAFDKAPRALALCEDETVIGTRFFIMERRPGVVVRGKVPEQFGGGGILKPTGNCPASSSTPSSSSTQSTRHRATSTTWDDPTAIW